jgi:hypothetical protein
MPSGQKQRFAANVAAQFAKRDDRPGERDRTDEHAEENLDLVDGHFDAGEVCIGGQIARETDQDCRRADEAVQNGDELGHAGHRHAGRDDRTNGCAHRDRAGQKTDGGRVVVKLGDCGQRRRQHGNEHADDAKRVAAPRRGLRGQTAKAQDEQHARRKIGNRNEGCLHGKPTCETSSTCAASPENRPRC